MQGDLRNPIKKLSERSKIVSYGNRLFCDTDNGILRHRWGATQAKEHKQKLDFIKQLQTEDATLQKQIIDLEREVADLPPIVNDFDIHWNSWVSIHRERGDIIEQACQTLTKKSSNEIETELKRGADYNKALLLRKNLLTGCNIRENNWETLKSFLENDNDDFVNLTR